MNIWAIAFGVAVVALIVLIILIITRVFHPKPQRRQQLSGRDIYSEKKLGLFDTTVKCRQKYKGYLNAFGNNKRKYSKGCYTCPPNYVISSDEYLDYENMLPKCVKAEYQPAKPYQGNLGCPLDENSWLHSIQPTKDMTPWETIQPNVCQKYQKDKIDATFLGPL